MTSIDATAPPFDLPEEVALGGGRSFTGSRARVYWLLRFTWERRHQHPMATTAPTLGPFGWVPIHTLRAPWAGGAQGDRRLRDLHEAGVDYEVERWSALGGPRDSAATLYRITRDGLLPFNAAPGAPAPLPTAPPPPPPQRFERFEPRRHLSQSTSAPLRTDLSLLRFWTHEGKPPAGAGAAIQVDAGREHQLAPPMAIALAVSVDQQVAAADEAYSRHLLEVYHRGGFAAVSGLRHLVVWTSIAGGVWSPLPVLVRALTRLGAHHQGPWQGVA